MSYDLYFYKRTENKLHEKEISEYLNNNLTSKNENDEQWFVEDEDTESYFSIDYNSLDLDEETIEIFDKFNGFEFTHFSFNLNFLRPDFFGLFAFEFVDKFIKELDLFVLNPQTSDTEFPFKPIGLELYENWSKLNEVHSVDFFTEYELVFYPIEKSNDFYNYNRNRSNLQEKLGDEYFVPKIFLLQKKSDKEIFTLCTWPEHIPTILPLTDFYLLTKKHRKLLKTVEESGIISKSVFIDRFENFFDKYEFMNCRIIHPDFAEKVKKTFNSTKFESKLTDFAERVQIDKLVNVKPND
jgi:hypothetical protein